MIIIGEKINGTRKSVGKAIAGRDADFIQNLARRQVDGGASYLDVNAGTHPDKEPEDMVWLVNTIQSVTDVPLCLDSANPPALAAGLEVTKVTPMLNSLSGEEKRIQGVLPLAAKNQTELIVLALDDNGIPATGGKRLDIIRDLITKTRNAGLADEKLYIDPLVIAIATDIESANKVVRFIRLIREEFPDVHITSGLSNISFGMPMRTQINQMFLGLAMAAGMDSAIIDPENRDMRTTIYTTEMLLGKDRHCLAFSKAYRTKRIGTQLSVAPQ